jgi:type II secretory pathway pseudopilin PulG
MKTKETQIPQPVAPGASEQALSRPAVDRRSPNPSGSARFSRLHERLMRRKARVPRPRFSAAAGFTLVEVSAILGVLAILSVILVPQIRGFVHSAQRVRASNDLQALCNSMIMLMRDVGPQAFRGGSSADSQDLSLLVSSGDIPELGKNGDSRWLLAADHRTVDFLDNYLITNTPGGDPSRRFPTPADPDSGRFAWRGAYLSGPLGTDPWGNRYMINIEFLKAGSYEDIVVYSAGPNEKVESEYARDGLLPGGDDMMFLLARDGGGNPPM